jgi:hypothetical protein
MVLATEADQVNYVVTGYLLGLHFDTEMPAATEVLHDPYLNGTQKADWLQQWTQQFLRLWKSDKPQPAERRTYAGAMHTTMIWNNTWICRPVQQPYMRWQRK